MGNLGYKPNIHRHKHHLQHGLKQQTLSIKNTQQDLTSGIKDSDTKGMQVSREVLQASKQLLLTKHLKPYCQVISSSFDKISLLTRFCSSSLNQIKALFIIIKVIKQTF